VKSGYCSGPRLNTSQVHPFQKSSAALLFPNAIRRTTIFPPLRQQHCRHIWHSSLCHLRLEHQEAVLLVFIATERDRHVQLQVTRLSVEAGCSYIIAPWSIKFYTDPSDEPRVKCSRGRTYVCAHIDTYIMRAYTVTERRARARTHTHTHIHTSNIQMCVHTCAGLCMYLHIYVYIYVLLCTYNGS
jgi:hypothetical protein